jgi:hypothetical protein
MEFDRPIIENALHGKLEFVILTNPSMRILCNWQKV